MQYVIGFIIALFIALTGVGAGTITVPVLVLFLGVPAPVAVGSTPRRVRSSSRTPIACSRSAIDLEIAGCVVLRSAATLLMLPACTTVIRTCRSCSFSRMLV